MSTSPDADGASGAFLKKAGWLKKKSPGGFLGIAIWQSRYVVVDEETETLKYFRTMEDADAGKAAGELSFNEIVRVKGDPANSNFEIQTNKESRTYYFDSSDIAASQTWLEFFSSLSNASGAFQVDGVSAAVRKRRRKDQKELREAEVLTNPHPEDARVVDQILFAVTVELENKNEKGDMTISPFFTLHSSAAVFGAQLDPTPVEESEFYNQSTSSEQKWHYVGRTETKESLYFPCAETIAMRQQERAASLAEVAELTSFQALPSQYRSKAKSVSAPTAAATTVPKMNRPASSMTASELAAGAAESEQQFEVIDVETDELTGSNKKPLVFRVLLALPIPVDKDTKQWTCSPPDVRVTLYNSLKLGGDRMDAKALDPHDPIAELEFSLPVLLDSQEGAPREFLAPMWPCQSQQSFWSSKLRVSFVEIWRTPVTRNTNRFVHRAFLMNNSLGQELVVHESLEESPYPFQVARVIMQSGLKFRQLHSNLLTTRKNFIDKRLKEKQPLSDAMRSLVLSGVEEDPDLAEKLQIERLVDMLENNKDMDESAKQMSLVFTNYDGAYKSLRFKPSSFKDNPVLSHVSTNLHRQNLLVTSCGTRALPLASTSFDLIFAQFAKSAASVSSSGGSKDAVFFGSFSADPCSVSTYDTVTVGAFSAHSLKFTKGGTSQLNRLYDQELIKHPKEPDALINGVEELQQVLQQRREIVFSQALSMCITAFITALMRGISQPALLERYLDCGFLLQVESLLSTFGTEIGMLSDHDAAIQFLRRVRFELRPLPFDNAHENVFCESTQKFVPWRDASDATHHPRTESQTLSSAGVRPPGSWQSTSKTIEQTLPFCDTPLLGVRQCKRTVNQSNGLPTLVDMHAHGITPIVRAIQFTSTDVCNVERLSETRGQSTRLRFAEYPPEVVVDVFLPRAMHAQLPARLKEGQAGIPVYPILITQGVNEMQSVANASGSTAEQMQFDINMHAVRRYQAYIHAVAAVVDGCEGPEAGHYVTLLESATTDVERLRSLVRKMRHTKCLDILSLASGLTRRLGGARTICCKSAKDRTSMSTTWEGVNLLKSNHDLAQEDAELLMKLMRVEGVRRNNVFKNTTKALFAFNPLQRSMLPDEFQCPAYICGKVES